MVWRVLFRVCCLGSDRVGRGLFFVFFLCDSGKGLCFYRFFLFVCGGRCVLTLELFVRDSGLFAPALGRFTPVSERFFWGSVGKDSVFLLCNFFGGDM